MIKKLNTHLHNLVILLQKILQHLCGHLEKNQTARHLLTYDM